MIQELLEKYKDQQPKQYGNNVKEKSYPVSAVISMLEELTEQLRQYNVVRQSEQCVFHSTDLLGKCFVCGKQVFERKD